MTPSTRTARIRRRDFPRSEGGDGALFLKASKLPRVDIERPENAIGKTTVQSMQSGAVRGYVGALTGIITDIQKELGGKARVVATGGMGRMMRNTATSSTMWTRT